MAEGQTATNPQTGERVVLRGGQWVPLGGAARPQSRSSSQPRGLRNNNPGNIEDGAYARSLPGYAGSDGRFAIFDSPDAGGQAKARLLGSYINRGFNTPASIINRWAPPSDNNPTQAYADYVARRAGVGVNDRVTEDQIPLIAQAISEFENGNTVELTGLQQQPQAVATQTATNPATGEKMQLVDGQWQVLNAGPAEVEINEGVSNIGGRAVRVGGPNDGEDLGSWTSYQAGLNRSREDRLARLEREADPEYQAAFADAQAGSENVPDWLRALSYGQTLGFTNEINARAQGALQSVDNAGRRIRGEEIEYGAGAAMQAARDSERDAAAAYAREKPIANFGLQLAGGLLTPGVGPAGRYIEGAEGAARMGRAAGVGAGYGVASGLGYGEGNVGERLDDAAIGGLVGAGTGVIGQRVLDSVTARQAAGTTSAARRLSRQGVDLMPGQMLSETPIIGDTIKYAEDIAGGFNPLMNGVRRRQNEQVIRAAGNEALGALENGTSLPRTARTGYQVSQNVSRVLGDSYDNVTSRVAAVRDPEVTTDLQALRRSAAAVLDDSQLRRLERVLEDNVEGEFIGDTLTGENFKRIETTLRQQSERANRPTSTLQDQDLSEYFDDAREIVRNMIARQYPEEAAEIQRINRGWAINKRIQRAVTGSAGFSRQGTPTPGELTQTVANMSSDGQIMNETALLQGLATDARTVLPASVPDTGSGQRAVLGGAVGLLGTGAVATVSPALAGMIATGAVIYSRPGIATLNALYRATDSRAANGLVRQLAQQAQENPALIPYYEAALQHVGGQPQTDTRAAPPAQPSTPVPSAALQRVMQ